MSICYPQLITLILIEESVVCITYVISIVYSWFEIDPFTPATLIKQFAILIVFGVLLPNENILLVKHHLIILSLIFDRTNRFCINQRWGLIQVMKAGRFQNPMRNNIHILSVILSFDLITRTPKQKLYNCCHGIKGINAIQSSFSDIDPLQAHSWCKL